MARKINRLSTRCVAALLERANRGDLRPDDYRRHADGGNLYLVVSENGGLRWVFLYRWRGKLIEIGLGSARDVSLASARHKAAQAREQLAADVNPKDARKPKDDLTFDAAARALIESMTPAWRNATHRAQWHMTLLGETPPDKDGNVKKTKLDYCAPVRSKLMSAAWSVEDALLVLKPLWLTRPSTAQRLRGRCERTVDFARVRGHGSGENPFRWRGLLDALLPKRQRIARNHFAAMAYADVPTFMARLRSLETTAALALEFAVLTVARSAEALGARWVEIDLGAALWAVPPGRMKAGAEHQVPLSPRALAIVKAMHQRRNSDFVFPGRNPGKPLGATTFFRLLRRMGITDTQHGFRRAFRDWCGDKTTFAHDVMEACLAHQIPNPSEAAYRRWSAIEKRRKVMDAWAAYCERPAGRQALRCRPAAQRHRRDRGVAAAADHGRAQGQTAP